MSEQIRSQSTHFAQHSSADHSRLLKVLQAARDHQAERQLASYAVDVVPTAHSMVFLASRIMIAEVRSFLSMPQVESPGC
eukprot:5085548-Amphidinium_carterae.1